MSRTLTEEDQQLLMLRGLIAGLGTEQRARVEAAADRIRAELKNEEGIVALALVGAEQAAQTQ